MTSQQTAQVVISGIVVISFTAIVVAWMAFPPHAESQASNILSVVVGALAAGYGTVINFWFTRPKDGV